MKELTIIVALAVSSTFLLFTIQSTNVLGQFFLTLDFILTPALDFNRYYFELFKCHQLATYCCNIFEKKVLGRTDDRVKCDSKMRAKSVSATEATVTDTNTRVDDTVTIEKAASGNKNPSLKNEMSLSLVGRDSIQFSANKDGLETIDIDVKIQ